MHSIDTSIASQIILENSSKKTRAILVLNEGARIKELMFDGIDVIKEEQNFKYSDSYASSILFPFVSRIQNGVYTFQENTYQLACNNNSSALHGLVYNKTFRIIEYNEHEDCCSVTLNYNEKLPSKGFPFPYDLNVIYTLCKDYLSLKIAVKNTGKETFPFTLGWHPYFYSENLKNSFLEFKADKKVVFDKDLITKDIEDYKGGKNFKIENKELDDCFFLKDNKISFSTPNYKIDLSSNVATNFLQLYTPSNRNSIAVEPMTGISNSFNNKTGLQMLEPNKIYEVSWNVDFTNLK